LLLPLAVAVLPIWLSRDRRLERRIKLSAIAGAAVLAVIAVAGYLIPWAWTGFVGNSLWDWLNLVALPLAVAIAPAAEDLRKAWTPRHTTIALTGGAVFGAVVLAGYLIPWAWTGFTGNTLWAWLHLLLLPLLIPTLVVPALKSLSMEQMVEVERAGEPEPALVEVERAGEPDPAPAEAPPAPAEARHEAPADLV
jgi:Na+/H+-dicarboxylate symporter